MGFKNPRFGGKNGCLALVVEQDEIRRLAKDNTMDCSRTDKPQLLNLNIVESTTTTDKKILTEEHRVTWY